MTFLCALGLHRWRSSATARPGTTVHRCARCDAHLLTHGGRGRRRKRGMVGAALLLSAALWFVGYNLVVHGRTRVIHTARASAQKVQVAAGRGRKIVHRIEGDSGAYVEGND
ncbi:hypothetical protein ACMGDM_01430 [Sphingomonas sp. DT-51]|uniref:hypothetical protein n=1 Tax=Sphingomonas sp. DT-51 TaxID=3396165 RepID=UPI003F1A9334